ncbi:uncharacterized protein [Venturia canescens]|uniref:uncharacterized protein n=1 Tax=Venturia canescens TaxID=32260 RepID=UPI001C9D596E|nr:uncharacterized protein LOC122410463 [Venturia canescens]XP_043274545.1 uncharacterized protein LOC122410463 [Venturia canescens]
MSKRRADIEELRAKIRKVQQDIAGIVPLLESELSESDSGESTSSSMRAFRALTKDEGNKENIENCQSSPGKTPVDPEILDILGLEVDKDKGETTCIDEDLVNMWQKLINKGLTKEEKEELLKDYKRIPALEAKKVNPEILASLAPKIAKKDSYLTEIQNLAGASLMATGMVLTLLMRVEECDKLELVKKISDIAKINIAVHHSISVTRKANIFIPDLAPQVAGIIKKAEMDETLYGNDLGERIKESKALTRLSQDIKQKTTPNPEKKTFLFRGPSQRKPLSASMGNHQSRAQSRSFPFYKSKQQHFNRRSHRNSESSRREK